MGPSQGRPNACLSNSVPGFGVPKHQSHSINLPKAAILCGFDRLMQTHSIHVFFLLVRTLGKDFDTFIQPGRCKGWMSP